MFFNNSTGVTEHFLHTSNEISTFPKQEPATEGSQLRILMPDSVLLGFPSCSPKFAHAIFVIGPQRNSKLRILEIYGRAECCCSPRQAQNFECLNHSLICSPFCLMQKCCCGPRQDQNFEVCHDTTTIVIIKIIKKQL